MVQMIDLQNFLETVLFTGYLDDEKPVSIIIIAKPERGKTAVVSRYMTNKGVYYFTDVTAWGISDMLIPAIQRKEIIHHIIIPDFLNCVVKNRSTSDKLIMFLNALTEEGITNIASYANRGIEKKVGEDIKNSIIKCGVITCITKLEYEKRKKRWQGLGFLSRFLPIQYEYNSQYVNKIFDNLSNNNKVLNPQIKLEFPDTLHHVELPYEIAKKAEPYAKIIGKQIDAHGIRLFEIFRTLLKANALKNKRNIVIEEDLNDLIKYIEFIKYLNSSPVTIGE